MKKELGRFLILAFGLGLMLFLGAAAEALMSAAAVVIGSAVCLCGCWLSAHFLLQEPARHRQNAIRVDFTGSGRAA